jgi:hypothetical protein
MFHTEFVGIFIIYVHTIFLMSRLHGSSNIPTKLEANYKFHMTVMSLFLTLQGKLTVTKFPFFL